ncbi:MAG TPA: hypothetical protein VNZ58_04345 [Thermomicrobiales bacterium]|nr:hypothetical protein [Thermomicrobiales bacterium]
MSTTAHPLIPQPENRSGGRRFALWFSVLVPIASWAAHLGISWGLVPYSCDRDDVFWLHANTAVFAVVTILAFLIAAATFRNARNRDLTIKAVQTDHFMSLLGMLISGFFLILILAEGATVFVLSPCGIAS